MGQRLFKGGRVVDPANGRDGTFDVLIADGRVARVAADIAPYYLRKVRILNGAHTALAAHALPLGLKTVGECMVHPEVGPWLEALLAEEIVPVLEGRVDDPAGFARTTMDRFRNPFFEHALSAIALNHEAKLKTRLLPTLEDFRRLFGREPRRIATILGRA
jgi:tagaturonate reductase